LRYFK